MSHSVKKQKQPTNGGRQRATAEPVAGATERKSQTIAQLNLQANLNAAAQSPSPPKEKTHDSWVSW